MTKTIANSIAALVLTLASGCADTGSDASSPPTGAVTYHRDVEPILQRACLGCHGSGGVAPILFDSYEHTRAAASLIVEETEARRMPPWGALPTDECTPIRPFLDDPHLSEDEIATLSAWQRAGAPEGDPAEAPPPYSPPTAGLVGADIDLAPDAAYDPGDEESYRCFVLDPQLEEDTYIDGYEIVPGDRGVVHHALVFIDPERRSPDLADDDGGYPCFGSPKLGDTSLLGAWAPGAEPFELPADIGILVPANSLLVMQVHYHPNGSPASDTTHLLLRTATEKPARRLDNVLLGNFDRPLRGGNGLLPGPDDRDGAVEFRIPAGAAGHTEKMRYTLDFPIPSIQLFGAGTHMHRAGIDMKIDRIGTEAGTDPGTTCLLQTPQWDFDWQRIYRYEPQEEQYPLIHSGDTIELRCTYDNTLDNSALAAQLAEEGVDSPIDIQLGESTLDEMCVGFLALVYPTL